VDPGFCQGGGKSCDSAVSELQSARFLGGLGASPQQILKKLTLRLKLVAIFTEICKLSHKTLHSY